MKISPTFQTIIVLSLLISSCTSNPNGSDGRFAGMFIFGTSVVDNGNNNYMVGSLAKVNYTPYGVDFPFGPTGRYTNGETIADHLGRLLGLPLIPAFLDPTTKGARLLHGVNYGSGGSGILDTTGSHLGGVMSMNQQIKNFLHTTLPQVETLVGRNRNEILSQYLFMVATGNNDISGHYFNPGNMTSEAYVDGLMADLSKQLKNIYADGGRNFVLFSVYPVGCNPWIREFTKVTGCNAAFNAATHLFHTRLLNLVNTRLKPSLPGSEFIVVNTPRILLDVINDPIPKGFKNVKSACCELKSVQNVRMSCIEGGRVCRNRNEFVFFDGQHHTQAVNDILATKAFSSSNKLEVYPFNVNQLASCV